MKISTDQLKQLIAEEIASLVKPAKEDIKGWGAKAPVENLAKKSSYGAGWEKAKGADPLISHSCATHASMKNLKEQHRLRISETDEIGEVVHHTLLEDGTVTHYNVKFGNKVVKNIPANRLLVLRENHHSHKSPGKK